MRFVGVIDIGKTNAKFAVVDRETMAEVAVRTTPNTVVEGPPYPHYDIRAIRKFLYSAIRDLNASHPLAAISITTHGASAALVDDQGQLALPVLDYESGLPEIFAQEYEAVRPDFATGFTPRLPQGLNLGAQLFYQARAFPDAFRRTRWILTYPQYWAFLLTGIAASESTSLGCHTDLWDFPHWSWSSLVTSQGWRDKFPPLRRAGDRLGPVKPALAAELELAGDVPVLCGIHDSNASLVPHIVGQDGAFSVVSTGTWVISASPGAGLDKLDPARDCLANIDALGRAVPSARFMGGREYSMLTQGIEAAPDAIAEQSIAAGEIMLLPSVVRGCGPYPDRQSSWTVDPALLSDTERVAAISYYLALMTADSLAMTSGQGPVIVEGPFARNGAYCRMLAAASGRAVEISASATGTSIGAAMLLDLGAAAPQAPGARHAPEPALADYAARWRQAVTS
ncbi:FGGY-family carbohydrate kinase [Pelagibacterium sediminicola]|uniref:FGGY-family carbohydrate kinase n=1 Tax=Pelagibacterium sediminicola TaxID=2248761 RepID=UPI000E311A74|nr:FGGY-family carbohydrate kinase [Pelagibacterium sediminicola]